MVIFSIKSNRNVNIFLAIMTLAASLRFITRGYLEITNQVEYISDFSKNIIYVIGFALPPLYFKYLVFPKSRFGYKDLIHFVLPMILVFENKLHLLENLIQVKLYAFIIFLIVAIIIYYTTVIYLLLRKHIWKKTGQLEMETEQTAILKRWTLILFMVFTLMGVRLIVAMLFLQDEGFVSDNYLLWVNSFAWFVAFMMILTSPSILNGYVSKLTAERTSNTNYDSNWCLKPSSQITNVQDFQLSQKINNQLEDYFLQIDQYVKQEHFFRQSGPSISDLSLKLKIPKSHLSFIFKYHSKISFSDYKKLLRIQDSICLIEDGYLKTNTFDSLSKKVGFSTYNTFYIAFKEVTSMAPQEYFTTSVT